MGWVAGCSSGGSGDDGCFDFFPFPGVFLVAACLFWKELRHAYIWANGWDVGCQGNGLF